MTNLIIGLLGALLASNTPAATSNLITQTTGLTVTIPDTNDPVEREYQKLLEADDAALAGVAELMSNNDKYVAQGGGLTPDVMNQRMAERLTPARKGYEAFIASHPDHVRARIAFGSFLSDIHDDEDARTQFEKALELDPKNPAAWNDYANLLGHLGPVSKMFEGYTKAIELKPTEPVYLENLATCVFIYRVDAKAFYHYTNDQQVFDKSLELYQQAFKLDPDNFELATELAQTYYGITPTRTDDALNAWTNALAIARTDLQKQGVYIHLARFKLNAGRFAEAHHDLEGVTNPELATLKKLLLRTMDQREHPTNAPPVLPSATPSSNAPKPRRD